MQIFHTIPTTQPSLSYTFDCLGLEDSYIPGTSPGHPPVASWTSQLMGCLLVVYSVVFEVFCDFSRMFLDVLPYGVVN